MRSEAPRLKNKKEKYRNLKMALQRQRKEVIKSLRPFNCRKCDEELHVLSLGRIKTRVFCKNMIHVIKCLLIFHKNTNKSIPSNVFLLLRPALKENNTCGIGQIQIIYIMKKSKRRENLPRIYLNQSFHYKSVYEFT